VARSIYIASAEGYTGKSSVALGMVDLFSSRVQRVGVFRPIARTETGRDSVLELLLGLPGVDLDYEDCIGVHYEQIHTDQDAALGTIVQRYRELERRCDAVVVVGSDYTDLASPNELAFNARVAANLGSPVILVVQGVERTPEEVRQVVDVAVAEIRAGHANVVAIVANRCNPEDLTAVANAIGDSLPVFTIPEIPLLSAPTVAELMKAVHGELTAGDPALLDREAESVMVGAMSMEHLLDRLRDGAVVITPGDRSDILLGLVSAHSAEGFPSLAAVILNGGFEPPAQVSRLVSGLGQRLPIIRTDLGTYATARGASEARGMLSTGSQRKLDTAKAAFETHVAGDKVAALLDVPRSEVVTPLMFEYELMERARRNRKHIVLPEGTDDRILRAASTILARGFADITLLGSEAGIRARAGELGLALDGAKVIDPHEDELRQRFAQEYAKIRAHKGMTVDRASEIVAGVSYFGTLMVHLGLADGMVSGAVHTTAHTIKPAFEIIKTVPGTSIVSSVFFMCLADRVLVYGDCAVNPDPTAEQLADIAISSAQTAAQFGVNPRVAMLSYSTGESGSGADVDKVRTATGIVRERRPDLVVEGPIQYDAAVDASVAKTKLPGSEVAGKATVFIFPDLNTGNNTYKAVQRSAGAVAVGPVLQGLNKPVNDLSRGALVKDIVNTVAITAVQAQGED
jgi:phosphate acetyltransferase